MRSHLISVYILLCLAVTSVHAQSAGALQAVLQSRADSINSVAVDQGQGKVIVAVKHGDASQIVVLSLRDCVEDRRFNYSNPINRIITSPRESNVFFGGEGSYLKKWNLTDGTEQLSVAVTQGEPVQGLSISSDGNFIAAWGQNSLTVVNLQTRQPVWSETTAFPISDIALDPSSNIIYIGGGDGTLVKRRLSGEEVNSFMLESAVRSMAIDTGRQVLFIADGRQLIKYDIPTTTFIRTATIQADNILFSSDLSALAVVGAKGYTLFSYPDFKVIQMGSVPNNKFAMMKNGNIVTFNDNVLHFYDSRKNTIAGTIYLMENNVGFVSADLNYFGGDVFRDAILKGLVSNVPAYVAQSRAPEKLKTCAPFFDLLAGLPVGTTSSGGGQAVTPGRPTTPQINQPDKPQVTQPITPPVTSPSIPQVISPGLPQTTTPATPVIPKNISPSSPQVTTMPATPLAPTVNPGGVISPAIPAVPSVTKPALAPGADIPSWVMNPGALPAYSSVKSGADASQALNEAKKKIRDDVARDLMRTMLSVEMVKELPNDEIKKRFLWMVAGQTGHKAMQYVMQTDLWVSPQGQYYVLAQVDNDSITQIYEPTFQEEMKQLKTFGEEEYMQREPVKWD